MVRYCHSMNTARMPAGRKNRPAKIRPSFSEGGPLAPDAHTFAGRGRHPEQQKVLEIHHHREVLFRNTTLIALRLPPPGLSIPHQLPGRRIFPSSEGSKPGKHERHRGEPDMPVRRSARMHPKQNRKCASAPQAGEQARLETRTPQRINNRRGAMCNQGSLRGE